jgi:hypothetical protein
LGNQEEVHRKGLKRVLSCFSNARALISWLANERFFCIYVRCYEKKEEENATLNRFRKYEGGGYNLVPGDIGTTMRFREIEPLTIFYCNLGEIEILDPITHEFFQPNQN